jgi:intracellular sulfur oxidation DsrE/DsrF family protein
VIDERTQHSQELSMSFRIHSLASAIALGLVFVASAGAQTPSTTTAVATSAAQEQKKLDCTSKSAQSEKPKVVFQVNRAEDAPLILRFVTNYLKSEPEAEVTVVGYASGIDFMLKNANDAEGKAYAVQVNRLLDLGVTFKVCNNTLKARNAGAEAVLANVGIVPSAVNEIVRLQTQEGYSYFRH